MFTNSLIDYEAPSEQKLEMDQSDDEFVTFCGIRMSKMHYSIVLYGSIVIIVFSIAFFLFFSYKLSSWAFVYSFSGWMGLAEIATSYGMVFKNETLNPNWRMDGVMTYAEYLNKTTQYIRRYQRIAWINEGPKIDDQKIKYDTLTEFFAYQLWKNTTDGGWRLQTNKNGTLVPRLDVSPDGNNYLSQSTINDSLTVRGPSISTSGFFVLSDASTKENILPLNSNDAIRIVNAIKPVQYNYIGSLEKEVGVLSSDVKKVLPDSIKVIKIQKGGKEVTYDTVNYNHLIPVLLKRIQDMDTEIEKLQKRIEILEKKLN